MTSEEKEKIRDCVAAILGQVESLSFQESLSEQGEERLEEIKRRVLQIKDILRE